MVEPDVVSIFPVIVALAPPENAASPSFVISARPAARRTFVSGFIYLKNAIVLNMSFSESCSRFSSGVLGLASKR